ncbi:MAG: hypothetical protein NTV94_07695 [Planctomycetota bacterium]|nr:hypothetical protein [Planctomycetota bacterium]
MMIFDDLATAGSGPILEQMLKFAGARQRLLAHNLANIDTPNFVPLDVSPQAFQRHLAKAVAKRRETTGGESGALELSDTDEVSFGGGGAAPITLTPGTSSGNILYHDRNNRDVERLMQAVAENQLTFKTTADLLRRQNDLLRSAISQRV